MPVKATFLFNGSSQSSGKVWGFSESWYSNLADDALITAMDLVAQRRVQILSRNSFLVGYRIGQATGRSYVVRKYLESPSTNAASNISIDSALCQMAVANSPSRKKFFFHDLPDDWIVRTIIDPTKTAAINLVMQTLSAAGFLVRFQIPTAVSAPILSIDGAGVVVTSAAHGLAVGNTVAMLNCRDINNRAVRGTFVVTVVTNGTTFTVAHWTGQTVGRSGRTRLASFNYGGAIFNANFSIIGASGRKVGRPFFQSRGRVPVRR